MKTTYRITRLQTSKDKFDREYKFEVFETLTTNNLRQDLAILKWEVKSIEIGA